MRFGRVSPLQVFKFTHVRGQYTGGQYHKSNRKKVLFVIYDWIGGGSERNIYNLFKELKQDFDLRLLILNLFRETYDLGQINVKIYRFPNSVTLPCDKIIKFKLFILDKILREIPIVGDHIVNFLVSIRVLYRGVRKLREVVKIEKPDLVFCFVNDTNIVCLLSKLMFSSVKTSFIISVRNQLSNDMKYVKSSCVILYSIYKGLIRFLYNTTAEKIVTVSKGVKKDLIQNFQIIPKKIRVIYNGIPIKDIEELAKEEIEPELKYFFGQPVFKLVTLARLTEQKGINFLIDAFAETRQRYEFKLVILGDGHLRTELEEQAKKLEVFEDILFLGWRKNPFKYMAHCDLFVMSSLGEGFGLSLLEAMALGLPVISTDCAGPREILDNGKYGILIPSANKQALVQAISKVLEDSILRKCLREKAKERATLFSLEKMAMEYGRLIKNVLKESDYETYKGNN